MATFAVTFEEISDLRSFPGRPDHDRIATDPFRPDELAATGGRHHAEAT